MIVNTDKKTDWFPVYEKTRDVYFDKTRFMIRYFDWPTDRRIAFYCNESASGFRYLFNDCRDYFEQTEPEEKPNFGQAILNISKFIDNGYCKPPFYKLYIIHQNGEYSIFVSTMWLSVHVKDFIGQLEKGTEPMSFYACITLPLPKKQQHEIEELVKNVKSYETMVRG